MVRILRGDLFQSNAQTLVNTVNCVGVMGKGIALGFKERFPAMYQEYARLCEADKVKLGEPYLYKQSAGPWILNFPTKDHWRSLAKVDDIAKGLVHLTLNYRSWGITSLAVPPLGTGQGQLEWAVVGPLLYRHLNQLDIPVELYAPLEAPEDELDVGFLRTGVHSHQLPLRGPSLSRIRPTWVALVEILRRVQSQPYHWPVGRTTFQKMAYIAAVEGLPLEIEFVKGSYGPYSAALKPALTRLMNNGLIQERRTGNTFEILVGPSLVSAFNSQASSIEQWDALIGRVADLFIRTSTRRAEVIATVVFSAISLAGGSNGEPTEQEVIDAAMEWKQRRKPPFSTSEVALTVRNLAAMGWLRVRPSPNLRIPEEDFVETLTN